MARPPKSADELTAKQARFVAEYCKDQNGTQAAIRAGYSPTRADVTAARLLGNVRVSAAVKEQLGAVLRKAGSDAERVVRELELLGHSDIAELFNAQGDLLPVHQMPSSIRRAISSVEVETRMEGRGEDAVPVTVRKVKLWSKPEALALLAKKHGLLVDKHQLDATMTIRVVDPYAAPPAPTAKPEDAARALDQALETSGG